MNIFREFEDILGLESTAPPAGTLQEFFTLAREMRVKLDGKAYLLDRYLSYLLAASNEILCENAATDGFAAGQQVRRVCSDVVDGGREQANHSLYVKAEAYLDAHQLTFQEKRTRSNILVVAMMDEYLGMAVAEYIEEADYRLMAVVDMIHVKLLFDEISTMIGSEAPMERLNVLFRQRFLAVPVMAAFAQGLTHDLLYALIHRDPETSKQVFQLVLDHGFPVAVGGGDDAQDA